MEMGQRGGGGVLTPGLKNIIIERINGLRGRRFNLTCNSKHKSINYRLVRRVNNSIQIQIISNSTSKKGLTTTMRNQFINDKFEHRCVTYYLNSPLEPNIPRNFLQLTDSNSTATGS